MNVCWHNRWLAAVCLLAITGCGGGLTTHPVTGTITTGGKPVEGAAVTFTPDSADTVLAVGITDANGVYTLNTRGQAGAVAGTYKVTVAKYVAADDEAADADEAPLDDPYDITEEYPDDYDEDAANEEANRGSSNQFPPLYANPETSGLTATVEEGENNFDFSLEW